MLVSYSDTFYQAYPMHVNSEQAHWVAPDHQNANCVIFFGWFSGYDA